MGLWFAGYLGVGTGASGAAGGCSWANRKWVKYFEYLPCPKGRDTTLGLFLQFTELGAFADWGIKLEITCGLIKNRNRFSIYLVFKMKSILYKIYSRYFGQFLSTYLFSSQIKFDELDLKIFLHFSHSFSIHKHQDCWIFLKETLKLFLYQCSHITKTEK